MLGGKNLPAEGECMNKYLAVCVLSTQTFVVVGMDDQKKDIRKQKVTAVTLNKTQPLQILRTTERQWPLVESPEKIESPEVTFGSTDSSEYGQSRSPRPWDWQK